MTVAGQCHGRLSWVASLKYKVSFDTHQVAVLIAVLMMLKFHCGVISLSVLETLAGEQVVVLIDVLMMLNYHCNVLSPSELGVFVGEWVVMLIAVLMTLNSHCDVISLSVLEVLAGEHWLSTGLECWGSSGCFPFVAEAWLGIRYCLLLPLANLVASCSCQKGKVGLVATLVAGHC
jgi:hypothetical protein